MSHGSDDLTPRPAPCPSENKAAMIMPSVPDVSMVFDPSTSSNIGCSQSFMPTLSYTRPMFNRPTTKFEPIIEQDHHPPVRSPPPAPAVVFTSRLDQNPVIKTPHPVISVHQLDYHQQYVNHQQQMIQQNGLKQQYAQQSSYIPPSQNTCNCHHLQLSATPHIISQVHSENISDSRSVQPQSPVPQETTELKSIIEILKLNQSELRQITENNERNRKLSENLLLELQDYKKTITTILNMQNTIESKISEVEQKMQQNFDEIKTILNTKFNNITNNNNNNSETENLQILPKYINNGKLIFQNRVVDENQPNKFILSNGKNPTIFTQPKPKLVVERNSPVSDAAGQPNGEMKELFNKYEIKGAMNRRSIEYSVSSLSYLQRYGLLEEHK